MEEDVRGGGDGGGMTSKESRSCLRQRPKHAPGPESTVSRPVMRPHLPPFPVSGQMSPLHLHPLHERFTPLHIDVGSRCRVHGPHEAAPRPGLFSITKRAVTITRGSWESRYPA
jgi:hypothetical protein